jgi:TP901 family phage tail tape measure protein
LGQVDRQAIRTDSVFGGLSRTAGTLARTLGPALGLGALVIGFKKSIDAAGEFEKEFANVATLVDTTTVSMDNLKEGIMEMSVDVTKTTTDLTQGLYQVISAGVDSADALEVLRVSAVAATAGLSDTRTSVDAITTVLNAYGLAVDQATDVSDLMFQTVKLGKTTFTELASSIGTVISPAAAVGIELEDLFATIATLTKGGIETRTATMALRATLMSILKPTDDARKMAKKLGLEWSANALKIKGLIPFLNDMKEATGGNTEIMAELIPETRALNAVLALTGSQSEELNRILGEMGERLGSTQEAFEKQEDIYEAQAKKLGILVDRIQIKIGNYFLPALTRMLRGTLDIFDEVENRLAAIELKGLTAQLEDNTRNIKMWASELSKLETGAVSLGQRLREALTIETRVEAITRVKGSIKELATESQNLQKQITETMDTFKTKTNEATTEINKLAKATEEAAGKIKTGWKELTDDMKGSLEELGVVTKPLFDEQANTALAAFEQIADQQALNYDDRIKLTEAFFANLTSLAEGIDPKTALGFDPELALSELAEMQEAAISGLTETTNATGDLIKKAGDAMKTEGDTITLTLKGQAVSTQQYIKTISDSVSEWLKSATTQTVFEIDIRKAALQTGLNDMAVSVSHWANEYMGYEMEITGFITGETKKREAIVNASVQTMINSLLAYQRQLATIRMPEVGEMPSAQLGMPRVPRDMPVFVHEGEAIIPANQNLNNDNRQDNRQVSITINQQPGESTSDLVDSLQQALELPGDYS